MLANINSFYIKLLGFLSGAIGVISQLLGGIDILIVTLTPLMVSDFITGFLSAAEAGEISSREGIKGILSKMGVFFAIMVATLISNAAGIVGLRDATVTFYIINESVSILENLGELGVPLPSLLVKTIESLKEKE